MKIWVKLEGRRATKVSVSSGANIDDVIQEALRTEMLNIPPGCVSFHFDGKEVETDVEAVYYQEKATRQNPLILEIDHEGILLVHCVMLSTYQLPLYPIHLTLVFFNLPVSSVFLYSHFVCLKLSHSSLLPLLLILSTAQTGPSRKRPRLGTLHLT